MDELYDFVRPVLVLEAVENPRQKKNQIRQNKKGEDVEVSKKAHKVLLKIYLTDSTRNSPYPWVRPDFIAESIQRGQKPIRVDNLDKLEPTYDRKWMATLKEFARNVDSHSSKDAKIGELTSDIGNERLLRIEAEKEIKKLKAKLKKVEKNSDSEDEEKEALQEEVAELETKIETIEETADEPKAGLRLS